MKRSDLLEGIQKWREKIRHPPEKEKKRIFMNQRMFLILKEPSLICEPLTEVQKAMKESSKPRATDSRLKKLGFSILTHNESGFDTWYPLLSEKMAEIGIAHSSREDPNWHPIKLYVEETREPEVATYADVLKAMKEISDDGIPEGFGDSVFNDVGDPHSGSTGVDDTINNPRTNAILSMANIAEQTAKQSRGQTVGRIVKNKEQKLSKEELIKHIEKLLAETGDRCAITNLKLEFEGPNDQLRPSLDRIDSNGHYERGNLQVVARFINRWKSDTPDNEFRRLIAIVRGE